MINDLVSNTGTGSATFASALVLLVWFVSKAFATGTTLGSGSAGGLFAPSLVCGAMIGGAMAEALRAATAHYDGKYAVFRWKGEVVSTPRIMSPLHDELVLLHEDQALLEEIAARIRLAPAS